MATPKSAPSASSGTAALETTIEQRIKVRNVFAVEFGGAYTEAVQVRTPELFNALVTKRFDDLHPGDDGSVHSEVLKNTIDLLQRFHLCAPTFPELGDAVPDNMKMNVHALFWKATFCKLFCDDIENMDAGKVWCDVRRFVLALKRIWDNDPDGGREVPARARLIAAAAYQHRPAKTRSRKNTLLWQLSPETCSIPNPSQATTDSLRLILGMASVGLKEGTRHQNMETWAAETTARISTWKKLFKDDKDAILRSPIKEETRVYPKDVLPDYSRAPKQVKALRAREEAKALPMCEKVAEEVAEDESDVTMVSTPEHSRQKIVKKEETGSEVGNSMDGVVEDRSSDNTISPDGGLSWSMRPPYAHDPMRTEPINDFLAVVGRILDETNVRLDWDKQWKRSREN
ncbi:hypothetical protein SLS53_009112 [Cytospora paraplurivora]|uniref:Uncharacterized protein n=1 Tax=Cytospora paraplurivora TaxID=2898453 RepID=A0AAN9TZM8_9PEZI